MRVQNCWEFRDCGREVGGRRCADGVCPAATFQPADGYLGGTNGGCACAFITGTCCDDRLQGAYRDKFALCSKCEFFRHLRELHGPAFSLPAFAVHVGQRDAGALTVFSAENRSPEPPRTEPADPQAGPS